MEAAMIVLESLLEKEQRAFVRAAQDGLQKDELVAWALEIKSIKTTMALLQQQIEREEAVRLALHVKRA
jgi:hypothetical protein